MEASGGNSHAYRGLYTVNGNSSTSNLRRYSNILSASNIFQAPISTLLEFSGLLRTGSHNNLEVHTRLEDTPQSGGEGEVSIRIIGAGEHEHHGEGREMVRESPSQEEVFLRPVAGNAGQGAVISNGLEEGAPTVSANGVSGTEDGESNSRDPSYQRYDIQHAASWIEQTLPFFLLLFIIFIRLHLQGFLVTIWIAVVLFKSNDILRNQTALKGERKIPVLAGISFASALHVGCIYWWYKKDDPLYPLIMLPPKAIPQFWNAAFIVVVNDTMVRQAAMILKCFLLMYYGNGRGRNYLKQGQMLTLVEYLVLLYRALLPTPVWYRFFMNDEYGSVFSSLMTMLYLSFKITSVVEKVQYFYTALRTLAHKEVHYAYATAEQVNAAGDLCAICQEKMHSPILLGCKHIFCEDCVSEWLERERTCPLCRAVVKPAGLRSFSDGSTSLFFQFF
ncbi:hypothetical protein SAY87_028108 [Trapa incisa]|uniref:RING-type domain-containing protein n=1 Tax=Trapa incisa TaxID=236973 RepID=A0AAN7QNA8_9MYRT|nr:hypothetical protein SAY87_028108 [Trapa incisa]